MIFAVSATFDEGGQVSGIRYSAKSALELALEYWRQGCTNIRVATEDDSFSLEEFRMLIE